MPIFEYRCKKCGEEFEEFRYGGDSDISKDIEVKCPVCGTPKPERIFSTLGGTSESEGCGVSEYGLIRG